MLSRLSGGIPRLINVLCDRALLGAYIEGESAVSKRVLGKAAREVLGDSYPARVSGAALRLAMMALLAALFTVATVYYDHPSWLIPNFALSLLAPAQAVAQPAR
jgi:general secretion pathway protein A